MKILFVNRFFATQQVPTGRMLEDVVKESLRQGHHVTVFTSDSEYKGAETKKSRSFDVRLTVRYLYTPPFSRLLGWVLFWLQACLLIPFLKFDRYVVLTDPPFMVVAAWLKRMAAPRRQDGFYWWTMDLYPEALSAGGTIGGRGLLNSLLAALNELGISKLSGVVCLGRHQLIRLQRYKNWRKVPDFSLIVPPWDGRPMSMREDEVHRFRQAHGLVDKNVVLYAGNLGHAHRFEELVAAAKWLLAQGQTNWHFVFTVRGTKKLALQEASKRLSNVLVMDYVSDEEVGSLLGAADVHAITMDEGWQGIVVPSKLYGVLETRAPILYIGPLESDTADEIMHYHAGLMLPSGASPEQVVHALSTLVECPPQRSRDLERGSASRIVEFVTRI